MLQAVIENFREKELGGRIFQCMTGSAPTAPEVVDFLRDSLIVPVYEGYGSTEAGAYFYSLPFCDILALHDGLCASVPKVVGLSEGLNHHAHL